MGFGMGYKVLQHSAYLLLRLNSVTPHASLREILPRPQLLYAIVQCYSVFMDYLFLSSPLPAWLILIYPQDSVQV